MCVSFFGLICFLDFFWFFWFFWIFGCEFGFYPVFVQSVLTTFSLISQNFTDSELAEMPSCNLSETIHNKWLQQSGNRGSDLYVATVDDFVRAFMQCTNYYAYLKGDRSGTGPGKEELRLRAAQRSGDAKRIVAALEHMPGAEHWCTRKPQLEGEEVFGTTKRKLDLPPGSEQDSHRPDKVSFSHPRVSTRSTKARTDSSTPSDLPLTQSPEKSIPQRVTHVNNIQETHCDVSKWHISRLPKTSAKACFAMQARTKTKCTQKIVRHGKSTPAPTYTGYMRDYKKNKEFLTQFFFCNDDIERCVKGTRRKWVQHRPDVPDVWPVLTGTNLTLQEVLALEEGGFQLQQREDVSPRRLFGDSSNVASSMAELPTPALADQYPTLRFGKKIRRSNNGPCVQQRNKWESALNVDGQITSVTMIPHPGIGCIILFQSRKKAKVEEYRITISTFPSCTCPDFVEMSARALGKRRPWVNCKHLYFIFRVTCNLDQYQDTFIHAPSLSFNEVKHLLESGIMKLVGP